MPKRPTPAAGGALRNAWHRCTTRNYLTPGQSFKPATALLQRKKPAQRFKEGTSFPRKRESILTLPFTVPWLSNRLRSRNGSGESC